MKFTVSEGLNSLYDYMNRKLLEANIKKDTEILNQISGMLFELRDTWNEAMKNINTAQTYRSEKRV